MKLNNIKLYRWQRYFTDGWAYITYPTGIIGFLTTTYYLLIDNVSWLKAAFPNFWLFTAVSVIAVLPLSAFLGFLHIKKSQMYEAESVLMTEKNAVAVHGAYVSYVTQLKMLQSLNIEPPAEFMEFLEYWQNLDSKIKWRPKA